MSSKGTIKRIVSDKGFGFVADESGQEYFFHQSACQSFDALREGQAVTFQTGQGPKGPRDPRLDSTRGAPWWSSGPTTGPSRNGSFPARSFVCP